MMPGALARLGWAVLPGILCLVSALLAHLLVGTDLAPAVFWPPAGIALGGFLKRGPATLPASFLGTTVAVMLWDVPAGHALLLGAAVVVQAGTGGWLLRRVGVSEPMGGVAEFGLFVALGGLVAGALAALPAYAALGQMDWFWDMSPLRCLLALAVSNLLSALVVVPMLLPGGTDSPAGLGRKVEGGLAVLALTATTLSLAHPTLLGLQPALFRPYPLMPFLLWLALRGTTRQTALGLFIFFGLAATASGWGQGHLFSLLPDTLVLPIHGFTFVLGLSFLVLAVVMQSRARAERDLRTSEARLRNVISLIRNCLWETDVAGRFIYLDRHAESVFGLPAEAMLGRTPEEIWPDGLGPAMVEQFRRTRYKMEAEWAAQTYTTASGGTAYLETNCAALRDGESRHQGWQGITREVSERVRMIRDLDETNRRFRQLAENIQEVFWVSSKLSNFLYISPQCGEVLGLPAERLYSDYMAWMQLIVEADRPRIVEIWSRVGQRGPVEVEFRINHPRKGLRWLLARSFPFEERAGEPLNAGILEDITDRKRDVQARLDQAIAQRDALVREVHHRIKNNLQTVVALLRREAGKHPEARDAIASAIAQVRSVAVVHGLYGRLVQPGILLCDLLPAVLNSITELTGARIQFRGMREGCGEARIHDSETVALALILNELVTNAVKHVAATNEQAGVLVTMRWVGGQVHVRLSNPGHLPMTFDFAAGVGLGTGLGLVRALMPARGLGIVFWEEDDEVRVELRLEAPVLAVGETEQQEYGKDDHAEYSDRR